MISNGFRLKRDKETQFLVYEKRNDDQHIIIDYVKSGSASTYEFYEDNEDFLIENEKFRDGRIKVSIKKYVRPDGDLKNMRDFMVIVQNQIYYSVIAYQMKHVIVQRVDQIKAIYNKVHLLYDKVYHVLKVRH